MKCFFGSTDAEKLLSFILIRLKKDIKSIQEVTSNLPSLEELEADVERLPLRDLQEKENVFKIKQNIKQIV